MGFNKDISEKALVACGRSCCVCNKFCGTKIELHHINQIKDGGQDTFENCIPLCFDCHQDVMTYNPNHPKGRKYSETELIIHRDNHYRKIEEGRYLSPSIDRYEKLDREIYMRVREILNKNNAINFIKYHDFISKPYEKCNIEAFFEFKNLCNDDPEFHFIDHNLEEIKNNLYHYIVKLIDALILNTFPINNEDKLYKFPENWKENAEKVILFSRELFAVSVKINELYDELIKICRKRYDVNTPD